MALPLFFSVNFYSSKQQQQHKKTHTKHHLIYELFPAPPEQESILSSGLYAPIQNSHHDTYHPVLWFLYLSHNYHPPPTPPPPTGCWAPWQRSCLIHFKIPLPQPPARTSTMCQPGVSQAGISAEWVTDLIESIHVACWVTHRADPSCWVTKWSRSLSPGIHGFSLSTAASQQHRPRCQRVPATILPPFEEVYSRVPSMGFLSNTSASCSHLHLCIVIWVCPPTN